MGAKRALKPKQIWEIRFYLNQRRRLRDRALFDLAIDSKLRGCDLVQITGPEKTEIEPVADWIGAEWETTEVKDSITLEMFVEIEIPTGRFVNSELLRTEYTIYR